MSKINNQKVKIAYCYLAVGVDALKLFTTSYNTLLKAGFEGKIFLMTDTVAGIDEVIKKDGRIIVCELTNAHLNLYEDAKTPLAICDVRKLVKSNPRNRKAAKKFAICHAKTMFTIFIPVDKYDYVVYLDVDVLVAGPLSIFEEFLVKNFGKIITATSRTKFLGGRRFFLSNRWFQPSTVTANLTILELARYWHIRPICADIVCVPTCSLGIEMVNSWREESLKGLDSDQAALQAVLLRKFKASHVMAPMQIFGYGPSHHSYISGESNLEEVNAPFVHFNGALKDPSAYYDYHKKFLC